MVRNQIEPAWLSWGQAAEYSGLCVQTLRNAEKTGAFETRMVVIEGRSKGRRLINRESLDRWIWAQGEPQPKGLLRCLKKEMAPSHRRQNRISGKASPAEKKLTCVKRGRKFDRGHIVGSDDRQGRMHNDLLCEICTEGPESWVEQRRRQCMACDRWFNPYRTQKEPFLCRRCVEESAGQFELPLNDAS